MLLHDDRIAQPARGRFFPLTVSEVVKLLRDLDLRHPYRTRLNIVFRNPDAATKLGLSVAACHPADDVIVYSFPEDFDPAEAKSILGATLRALAELAKGVPPTDRRQKATSFRAYFMRPNRLTITRRVRRATPTRYRMGMKFSNVGKPKGMKTVERVVHSIDLSNVG